MTSGRFTARAITQLYLDRISRLDRSGPALRSVIELNPEALKIADALDAERKARRVRGPLHGIPFSIKDLAFTKGVRTMAGSFIYEHRVPDLDAPYVRRLKAAGGVFLGKTTTPEFGWKGLSDSPLTGATRNPWNLAMTAGGSSAGAGVGAAAGLCSPRTTCSTP